jgi:hypothetical protein
VISIPTGRPGNTTNQSDSARMGGGDWKRICVRIARVSSTYLRRGSGCNSLGLLTLISPEAKEICSHMGFVPRLCLKMSVVAI